MRLIVVLFLLVGSLSYGQKVPAIKKYRPGIIYYKNGKTLECKIAAYGSRNIWCKFEDGTKKKITTSGVKKFDIYGKKDTTSYGYFITEAVYKSKSKKKLKTLGRLVYDYDDVKLYGVMGKSVGIGPIGISGENYFLTRRGKSYGRPLLKAFKNKNKLLKEYLSNCKDMVSQIGTTYSFTNIKSLGPIFEYYNEHCKRKVPRSRQR
ncbi:hypothetical protein [Dokdonia sp.]|uniref:hypothetical protein n=1 Tax=Dokdonia sp. TaxID=2024995 RepID=UPI00326603A3